MERWATYLEGLTELNELGHALVHLVLHQGLLLLQKAILLGGNKVAEGRNRVGRGLRMVL